MKLYLCNPRGFCAGVVRAIKTVERALELYGPPIYVKHEIVHNSHVIGALKKKGVIFVEELKEVPKGSTVIYSAHGVMPKVREEALELSLFEIDATCPLVAKLHREIRDHAKRGYTVLLFGHKNHVEVQGAMAEAPVILLSSLEEAKNLVLKEEKIFFATQTTLSRDEVEKVKSFLLESHPKMESSGVCYATTNRQKALLEVVKRAELIYIVGDEKSSNSKRLSEIAKQSCVSYLIHEESEILEKHLMGISSLAITAGASTPEEIVQRCVKKLMSLGVQEVEEVVACEEKLSFPLPKELIS